MKHVNFSWMAWQQVFSASPSPRPKMAEGVGNLEHRSPQQETLLLQLMVLDGGRAGWGVYSHSVKGAQ